MEQNQNQNNNEIEIDLAELFYALWAKKFIIILAGVAMMLAAVVVSKVVLSETYESTTSVYIYNKESTDAVVSSSDLSAGSQLTKDFQKIMKSRTVLESIVEELNLDMTPDQLSDIISISIDTDTRGLDITVRHSEPYLAKDIADAVREFGSEKVMSIIDSVSVRTIDVADSPDIPAGPNVKRNGLLGAIVGLALAIFVVLLVYLLDDTIKTPEDVERYLGVGVLGNIPLTDGAVKSKKKTNRSKIRMGGK